MADETPATRRLTRQTMSEIKFEARVKATGLRPRPDDLPMLEALVKDLDRAAAMLRGPRPFSEEPLVAFRLKPG